MSEPITSTPISGTPLEQLTQDSGATGQFLDKHQIKLIALASLLIVVILSVVVHRELKQSQEQTAGALLVSKSDSAGLEGIIKNHEGTAAAGSAEILLAEQQWENGKEDDAISTLRDFVKSAETHPARATALASLASKLLKQGKTSDAEGFFTELTEDSGYLAAYAWIALGDIAFAKSDLKAAEKAYGTVEKDFSGTFYAQDAIARRLLMKADSPVEVATPVQPLDSKIIDGAAVPEDGTQIKNLLDAVKTAEDGKLPPGLLQENGNKK